MDDKELKVKSIRADDETYEKFKKLATNEFGNQGQCLTALINIYETETSKVSLVERKMEIESFQDYLNKISGLFLTSLQLNNDAEGRIRDEFARQLTSKDKTIEDLQSKIIKITSEKDIITEKYNDTVVKSEESSKRVLELTDSNNTFKSLVEEYKGKNDMLLGQMKQYEKYPEQLEATKELLSISRTKVVELNNTIKSKDEELVKLTLTIDELRVKHIADLEAVTIKEKFNTDILLLSKDKEYQVVINKLNEDNSNKVNSLLNQKEKINEKISKLMEENQLKDREINVLDMKVKELIIKIESKEIHETVTKTKK